MDEDLIEELLAGDWVKLEEALQHNSEFLRREAVDQLGEVVRKVLADVVALHHVDSQGHEVHVLHSGVRIQNLLGHLEGGLLDREVDFQVGQDEVSQHEDQLQIADVHLSEEGVFKDVVEELLEVVHRSLVDLAFLHLEDSAHQGSADAVEGRLSVAEEQVLDEVEGGETSAAEAEELDHLSGDVVKGHILVVPDAALLDLVHADKDFPNGSNVARLDTLDVFAVVQSLLNIHLVASLLIHGLFRSFWLFLLGSFGRSSLSALCAALGSTLSTLLCLLSSSHLLEEVGLELGSSHFGLCGLSLLLFLGRLVLLLFGGTLSLVGQVALSDLFVLLLEQLDHVVGDSGEEHHVVVAD
mmetsp:Transcript_34907/g.53571  ORF Transcript_34907/g.53571 Transcript_34907/m.53571 type:complete len:355 (+) Transcript_34907:4958-6022(+)